MSEVAAALERVRSTLASAAQGSGRDPAEVVLIAVSKEVPPERIREAIEAGHRDFGENRAQEAVRKHAALADEEVRWHFIGRLQRNKVRRLVQFVHTIHSVDRIALAEEISKCAQTPVEVLLEVNTSGEPARAGVTPTGLPRLAEATAAVPGVRLVGLMTMAPIVASPELARPYFRRLASLGEDLRRKFPDLDIRHLSMGMSQDYAVAVEEGATMVRVGQAIFGPRRA